jgi:hypothetical protein
VCVTVFPRNNCNIPSALQKGTTLPKAIETIREGWTLLSWSRSLGTGCKMPPGRRRELAEKIAEAPDDQRVMLSAGELRQLLAASDPPSERGARIIGTGKNEGVMYSATIAPDGSRRLRSVEIQLTNDEAYPRAFRVPVRMVEDLTRYVLGAQDAQVAFDDSDPADVVVFETGIPNYGGHSTDLLHQWAVIEKIPPKGLAEMLGLSESRIYQLLREAREQRPDLDWPAPRRGPKPKTTDGK